MNINKFLIILLSAVTVLLASCKDSENLFTPTITADSLTFRPIAGGAVCHYVLPDDPDIVGINLRYKDFKGDPILRTGSVFCDSLVLVGFNKATDNNEVKVSLCRRDGSESEPVTAHFSTYDSGAYAFFNGVHVSSGWDGFFVSTNNPADADGIAHVYYLGVNPYTGKQDTILLKDFVIKEGKDTMTFQLQQKYDDNTIVIRTEDFRGYMVREEVYPHIKVYNYGLLDPSHIKFSCSKAITDAADYIGPEYLFDGELKGAGYLQDRADGLEVSEAQARFRCYLAGPNAVDVPMYLDLGQERLCAQIRMYAMLYVDRRIGSSSDRKYGNVIGYYYYPTLPYAVDVYGAHDNGSGDYEQMTWTKLGSYEQSKDALPADRWCRGTYNDGYLQPDGKMKKYTSLEELNNADPISLTIGFMPDGQGNGYRYLKIVPRELFYMARHNLSQYISLQELQVYTKTDE